MKGGATGEAGPGRGGVQAADTVLSVLETVAWSEEPLGVTQIAAAVGIAKGAAFRHLRTLLDRGYLVQDAVTSRFQLGPRVSLLGRLAPPAQDLAALLRPAMREAREASGLAVVLSTPTPAGAFVLATLAGTQAVDIGVRLGSSLALHASAQGKVFLAFGPGDLPDRVLADPLPRFTAHTITAVDALKAELARVRQCRYAVAPEEMLLGVNAMAAPVRDGRGVLVGALALVGSIQHLPRVPEAHHVRIVLDLTRHATRLIANAEGRHG
ncbi:IclR family transcriptional regulator [Roseomonas sp. NAR14]|uniref:IclR family transcriptional regulator n=1 Tax=Roseomonas acroporae TaxID=2937791 RepID=A0A9X2BXU3_9PROT|nr:IclR family transcriptional regulator [Roseomonas acroporae]MCK8786299.1 IclR family transcriptional regulator [Roseomonas acroporae]